MKLNGIHILNQEALKMNFSLEQLWRCIENGTLYAFEQDGSGGSADLAQEILQALEGWEKTPDFVRDGRLDWAMLQTGLQKYDLCGYHASDKQGFFARNQTALNALAAPLCQSCTGAQARALQMFILLHLQAKPKTPISPDDCAFLSRQLELAHKGAPSPVFARLGLYNGEALLAEGAQISITENGAWKPFFSAKAPITSFVCTAPLGLIAISDEGALQSAPRADIRRAAAAHRLVMATARGEHYALLAAGGALVTNLKLPDGSDFSHAQSLHMGLNSITGITAPFRGIVQAGADPCITDFTGVRTVDTRNDGAQRFAVLCEDGRLYLDGGAQYASVSAACLCGDGYVFATGNQLVLRGFDGSETHWSLPDGFAPDELHAADGVLVCGGYADGKFQTLIRRWTA